MWYGGIALATGVAYRLADRLEPRQAHEGLLSLGTNVWTGYEPLYLGRSLGLFDPRVLDLVEYTSAVSVLRAFRNGTIDAAALTLDEVLTLVQHRVPARVVLVLDFSNGADALLVRPNIVGLPDLRGRTIGVEQGAVGAYLLARCLQRAELDAEEVRVRMLQVDEHERAYRSGEVDAVITFDPVRQRLLALGAIPLFDSSMIPEEIVDVLVVHQSVLEGKPAAVDHVIGGWFRALERLASEPEASAEVMSHRLGLTGDEVLAAYEKVELPSPGANRAMLSGEPPPLTSTARRLAEVMTDEALLEHPVDLEGLVDPVPLLRVIAGNEGGNAP